MRRTTCCTAIALAAALTACDRTIPTTPHDNTAENSALPLAKSSDALERVAMDRLARTLARALGDAEFRSYLKNALDQSPFAERKLQFQRFLKRSNKRVLRELARLSGESQAAIESDATHATPLEVYFPVDAHRAVWSGGPEVLVASARHDRDSPVAYDIKGRRQVLSPTIPPATPVLALVPVETDFGTEGSTAFAVPQPAQLLAPAPAPPPPSLPQGLYMTYARFVQDFEGWFKGDPEFELHILGQSGTSDSLTDYQCAGARAPGYYYFDQNSTSWSGRVLLFSQVQLNNYKTAHPNQNCRIIALEDDDTACAIKFDPSRFRNLIGVLQAEYPNLTGSKDTVTSTFTRYVKRANALQKILRAAYSFITTQDDLIGNAIEDVVVGQFFPGANWILKGEGNVTNGWIKLEMR